MKIHSKYFSTKFRLLYNLKSTIADDGYIYCAIRKGLYGLKQAAILTYQQLVTNLALYGYAPLPGTTGIWGYESRRNKFTSCVDDFGDECVGKDEAVHLIKALENHYVISRD